MKHSRSAALAERLEALGVAAAAGEGRVAEVDVARARAVVERATERSQLSAEHTVVALAGATGSGKSSLFNEITGIDLARVGVRRPTTAEPLACVWGAEGAGPLLDWLGIPRRHQVSRESALDPVAHDKLHGLVLLDLPDHDSTTVAHRMEVDRLVGMVDLLVWVVDPQKYADAVLHERYLRPLAEHAAVTVVVLNQVDRIAPEDRARCASDLRRLLEADGLGQVEVLPVSARTGEGLDGLTKVVERTVQDRRAAYDRLLADAVTAGRRLLAASDGEAAGVGDRERRRLVAGLSGAAGVDAVVAAVSHSYAMRARQAAGWPVTRWLGRFRPDPVRRLRLDRGGAVDAALVRTSLPQATPVARAQADSAVRALGDAASMGAPPAWVEPIRAAARDASGALPDALDQAVAGTDLDVDSRPAWWGLLGALQSLVLGVLVVGLLWLVAYGVTGWLLLPQPPVPEWGRLPVPTALLVGGLFGGLALSLAARVAASVGARRRGARARRRLEAAVGVAADRVVLAPVAAEVERLRTCREAARRVVG
ncbi:MAG TPA: GTP-binding protein [Jiangellales bacterium]|nr:GTP-binding protein [Jiangellales bacterium]